MDQAESPEIVDDFELGKEEAVDIKDKEVNKQKLKRRIDQYKVSFDVLLNVNYHIVLMFHCTSCIIFR